MSGYAWKAMICCGGLAVRTSSRTEGRERLKSIPILPTAFISLFSGEEVCISTFNDSAYHQCDQSYCGVVLADMLIFCLW